MGNNEETKNAAAVSSDELLAIPSREDVVGYSDLLAIRYFENRAKLKKAGEDIKSLRKERQERLSKLNKHDADDHPFTKFHDIDLSASRKYWLDCNNFWDSWVTAVEHDDGIEDDDADDMMKLAMLLDLKAEIRKEAGKIKRSFYNRGRLLAKLLRV